ncbi:MAG TPA: hypothetical protein VIH99_03210 [Bdellovibrionota bacterium]
MSRRSERSRTLLLQRLEGELDGIYDLIYQMSGDESHSLSVLERVLRRATALSRKERYERYLRLWALGITVHCIRATYPRFLAECTNEEEVPFASLSMEEKIVLFLHDRAQLSYEEIAGVMQISVGRVGRCLTYAREKVAQEKGLEWQDGEQHALRERLNWSTALEASGSREVPELYRKAMTAVRSAVESLPFRRFAEIESGVRNQKLLPLLGHSDGMRWQDLSWRYKLGLEASLLGAFGLIAVVALPWLVSRVNTNAFVEGRFADVFQVETQAGSTARVEGISTDRLLAMNEQPVEDFQTTSGDDEFANVDFPSGDGAEMGTAPVAPSRQSATVYRLIVQSPSPQELIPHVRSLFADKQVRERESSGRVMPGGVYFDGITSVGNYPHILREMQKLGQTKTYSNGSSRNPNERARVIVWVQQI